MNPEGRTETSWITHSPGTTPNRIPVAPPAGTRVERLLTRVDNAFAWTDGFIARWLPPEANPLAQAGAATNAALAVAIVSGIALLIWYSPSLQFAYSSLATIEGRTLGGWVRAIHRYSSDLAMVFVLVHAGRMFFARKFSGARWLPWLSGVALIGLIWFIGWTGYWLVWDQPAQQVAVTSMRLLDGLPIFGEPLGRLYIADRLVPSLLFFVVFFLHMLLPLAIAVGLAFHLLRVSRVKLFPSWKMTTAISVGLAVTALLIPAPLDAPAEMAVKAGAFTVDAWYLTPLALALRFKHVGLWVALFGTMALTAAIPWLLGRRRAPVAYQAVVEQSRCHACTQCQQDCPFDAITMVARTDGKRFPSQAFVDVSKCVGCGVCAGSCDSEGIVLPWFNTRREENRIENEITTAVAAGGSPWVALIAGDIDNGLALFAAARWRERLPHYQVHFVPTASWVRPMFIEHLLKHGAQGVLVVRDARTEAAARDGNRWVSARLAGTRTPVYRPDRAGGSTAWQVVDFDPARAADLSLTAQAFQSGKSNPSRVPARRDPVTTALAGVVLALVIAVATVGPSHLRVTNPETADPEFVFSFKAFGDHVTENTVDAAEDAKKPIHMRGRSMSKPQRAPVVVRLTINGVTEERSYRAMGISKDGPALDEWRHSLSVGEHAIRIELITGPDSTPSRWEGTIQAQPRRLHVITFEPDARFRVE
jgi:quinol-cytochrome oxidoreductase complex cytochrome b subunit/ferredoxin